LSFFPLALKEKQRTVDALLEARRWFTTPEPEKNEDPRQKPTNPAKKLKRYWNEE
jgi:hypothetical protein